MVKDLVIGYNNIACSLHFYTVHHHSNGYRTGLRRLLTKKFRFLFLWLNGDVSVMPEVVPRRSI